MKSWYQSNQCQVEKIVLSSRNLNYLILTDNLNIKCYRIKQNSEALNENPKCRLSKEFNNLDFLIYRDMKTRKAKPIICRMHSKADKQPSSNKNWRIKNFYYSHDENTFNCCCFELKTIRQSISNSVIVYHPIKLDNNLINTILIKIKAID